MTDSRHSTGQGEERPHAEVVAGAIRQGEACLLCQRPEGSNMAGYWEFPGGKVKEGETREEALRRELDEELGIDVSVGEHLSTLDYSYPHLDITLHLFNCPFFTGKPSELYHSSIRWIDPREIDRALLVPSNLPFLDILSSAGEDISRGPT